MQILNTAAVNPHRSNLTASAASAISSHATTPTGSGKPSSGTGLPDQLTSESTFLNLLVAQIKNQDPLNPTDSIQFVGQLVQFSQLEQLLSINQGITKLAAGSTPSSTSNNSKGT
jgi:flagellar basal-body rod modification protein FlgD